MKNRNSNRPKRSRTLQVLVTPQEADKIAALAAVRGESMSTMMRALALAAAAAAAEDVERLQQARAAVRKGEDNDEDSSSK